MTFSNKRGASDLSMASYTDEGTQDADTRADAVAAAALGLPMPMPPLATQQQQQQDLTAANNATNTVPAPTASLADISDGAKRLAQELDQYIVARGPTNVAAAPAAPDPGLSDDAIADLQLATARKLREVCSSSCGVGSSCFNKGENPFSWVFLAS